MFDLFLVCFQWPGHRKLCVSHMARLSTTAETEAEALANCLAHFLVGLLPSGCSQPAEEHIQDYQISAHTPIHRHMLKGCDDESFICSFHAGVRATFHAT